MVKKFLISARKRSLRRLCFHRCLSVHGGGCLPHCMLEYTPKADTPMRTPLGRHPALGRHPPGRHPPADPTCAVHAGIWSTSGWYASHWNAFLFVIVIGPLGALEIDIGPGDCWKESLELPFHMSTHFEHLLHSCLHLLSFKCHKQ